MAENWKAIVRLVDIELIERALGIEPMPRDKVRWDNTITRMRTIQHAIIDRLPKEATKGAR
jgi:hypothetical protein